MHHVNEGRPASHVPCANHNLQGDMRQGRTMALQLNTQQLFKECAHILEGCVSWRGGSTDWQAECVHAVEGC